MKIFATTTFATILAGANAHGHTQMPASAEMMSPGNWADHWYSTGSMIGCSKPSFTNCNSEAPCCESPSKPTIRSFDQTTMKIYKASTPAVSARSLRGGAAAASFASTLKESPYRMNPWYAPGHAPVANPCGILGGARWTNASDYIAGPGDGLERYKNGTAFPINGVEPSPNMPVPAGTTGTEVLKYDQNMRMQKAQGKSFRTNDNPTWKAGSDQEVKFSIAANHGGGHQYRLCKLSKLFDGSMDEDCFQANPMAFVGNTSWFEYTSNESTTPTRVPFTAVRLSDANTGGVIPAGSTWTKFGLPACAGDKSSETALKKTSDQCTTPQFTNEVSEAGFWGTGTLFKGKKGKNSPALVKVLDNFSLVDTVRVPEGLEGDYVVSWRWDSEQSPQVWTHCSVVTIEA